MGERINELEDAFRTCDLSSELADRVRKAVKDGFSPATVRGLSETGVPKVVLDRALNASEEYQRERLAPSARTAPTAVAEAPPLEPTAPPARVADPPPDEPPLAADGDSDDGGWRSLVS